MLLLTLDQQDLLVDPAQEEGLGHRCRDLLVPEVLHVLGFEVGEDFVAYVVAGELPGLGWGCGPDGSGSIPRRPVGRAQHDGQGVGRNLQKLLHLRGRTRTAGLSANATTLGSPKQPPRTSVTTRGQGEEPAGPQAMGVTCSSGPPCGHRSFSSGCTLASPGARRQLQGAETRREAGSCRRVRVTPNFGPGSWGPDESNVGSGLGTCV
ncbi:uncharacterized protein LOC132532789 [Erinaceus europaeus]|uniref:Uncharacterized protein LOC132532789 n=1 Tax=Erinaceus europaeus TaxID=9365 RepID=A0ABM3VTN7_ERIEU|nr:uncharacterized protein LOC132532789 [Erinaceus europaeus]